MQEFYFANYRLLTDDAIPEWRYMDYLSAFRYDLRGSHLEEE